MNKAIAETERRRRLQENYNKKHGITPTTIKKNISNVLHSIYEKDYFTPAVEVAGAEEEVKPEEIPVLIESLKKEMQKAAQRLEFEKATEIRDRIKKLREMELTIGIQT